MAEKLWEKKNLSEAFNFGPSTIATVEDVVELAKAAYGSGEVDYKCDSDKLHEANCLSLDTYKARTVLGITPKWDLEKSIEKTMNWYLSQYEGENAKILCERDIDNYVAI